MTFLAVVLAFAFVIGLVFAMAIRGRRSRLNGPSTDEIEHGRYLNK